MPFGKGKGRRKPPPFYSLNADLPMLLALVCGEPPSFFCNTQADSPGFQHSLAMIAGVITVIHLPTFPSHVVLTSQPPIIMASQLALPPDTQAYMISASLIASGILSMVQIARFKIPKTNYYIGTGLITVVGTSFASLSTASAVFNALYADGTCPSIQNADGTTTRLACPE
jgi:xanthine/uracil permease